MAETRNLPNLRLPSAPPEYDQRDQAELRRLVENHHHLQSEAPAVASDPVTIHVTAGNGTDPITPGVAGDFQADFDFAFVEWTIVETQPIDTNVSIVFDIWKAAFGTLPTVANTITASAKPALSSAKTGRSSALTGWTTAYSAGETVRVNVDSADGTVAQVMLALKIQPT